MRKTVLALILVIPMAFVIAIFAIGNAVSLNVPVSVNGITIRSDTPLAGNNTLHLDMADLPESYVTAEVSPANATQKGYNLVSSDPEVADLTKEGERWKIVPKSEGTTKIVATSNDGGHTDDLDVVITSRLPYDFDFTMTDVTEADARPVPLTKTATGYSATVSTGRQYSYGVSVHPVDFTEYSISEESDMYATGFDPRSHTMLFPFSGKAEYKITVPNGVNGTVEKTLSLTVEKPAGSEVIFNGKSTKGDDAFRGLELSTGATEAQLFVECAGGRPTFKCASNRAKATITGEGQYIVDITILDKEEEPIEFEIVANRETYPFLISFTDFAFSVFSDRTVETLEDGSGKRVTTPTGTSVTFYAVASSGAKDVKYTWDYTGPQDKIEIDGASAKIKVTDTGTYSLTVTAEYGEGETKTTLSETIEIVIVKMISVIQITNNVKVDLAKNYTIAGKKYNDKLALVNNSYPLSVDTYGSSGLQPAGEEIEYSSSNDAIARVELQNGSPVIVPCGTGVVTITASWKGNAAFGKNVRGTLTFNVVADAVAVKNSPELVRATDDKLPVVLTENITLGTDAAGKELSVEERRAILQSHRIKSTYNTEWYKNTGEAGITEDSSKLYYALEFTNSVYGNGKSIDASKFTHALDGTGKALFYKGPLYFVKYREMASVAGQDNCAFLIRTDGVTLYGVNLLGCSDSLLENENGEYDLTKLNKTGTTLEINASCKILNCRVRNGRNVVRAYGGNRNGNKYFIDSLSENSAGVNDERITVQIEGCILSQGREFILKIGANRALRASRLNGQEPVLRDANARAYTESGTSNQYSGISYTPGDYFYDHYVMTDVTLKNSVLETSGLFTVGIESNFSGEFLYEGASNHDWRTFTREWERSGGTSFASVLRLEGDVRLYDWKDISLIDASTLIESPIGELREWLKLDIKGMIDLVSKKNPSVYGNMIETTSSGKQYVHGGIALYGGGRNYSSVDLTKLENSSDLEHFNINISVLKDGTGFMPKQGDILPGAAGTHDFNFYMYSTESKLNFVKQENDELKGLKYKGVSPVELAF